MSVIRRPLNTGAAGVSGNGIVSSNYDPSTGTITFVFDNGGTTQTSDLRAGTHVSFTEPSLTYTNSLLTGITYAGGQTKTLSYVSGVLSTIETVVTGTTVTKTLNYTNGVLTSITET